MTEHDELVRSVRRQLGRPFLSGMAWTLGVVLLTAALFGIVTVARSCGDAHKAEAVFRRYGR